mmetsp:Transcript_22856/g.70875  ORF Transcript_22856/g.70875 Transcript_22856/m.70875 type:complete len:626 (-) Transcript_22856:997-2874(-)
MYRTRCESYSLSQPGDGEQRRGGDGAGHHHRAPARARRRRRRLRRVRRHARVRVRLLRQRLLHRRRVQHADRLARLALRRLRRVQRRDVPERGRRVRHVRRAVDRLRHVRRLRRRRRVHLEVHHQAAHAQPVDPDHRLQQDPQQPHQVTQNRQPQCRDASRVVRLHDRRPPVAGQTHRRAHRHRQLPARQLHVLVVAAVVLRLPLALVQPPLVPAALQVVHQNRLRFRAAQAVARRAVAHPRRVHAERTARHQGIVVPEVVVAHRAPRRRADAPHLEPPVRRRAAHQPVLVAAPARVAARVRRRGRRRGERRHVAAPARHRHVLRVRAVVRDDACAVVQCRLRPAARHVVEPDRLRRRPALAAEHRPVAVRRRAQVQRAARHARVRVPEAVVAHGAPRAAAVLAHLEAPVRAVAAHKAVLPRLRRRRRRRAIRRRVRRVGRRPPHGDRVAAARDGDVFRMPAVVSHRARAVVRRRLGAAARQVVHPDRLRVAAALARVRRAVPGRRLRQPERTAHHARVQRPERVVAHGAPRARCVRPHLEAPVRRFVATHEAVLPVVVGEGHAAVVGRRRGTPRRDGAAAAGQGDGLRRRAVFVTRAGAQTEVCFRSRARQVIHVRGLRIRSLL